MARIQNRKSIGRMAVDNRKHCVGKNMQNIIRFHFWPRTTIFPGAPWCCVSVNARALISAILASGARAIWCVWRTRCICWWLGDRGWLSANQWKYWLRRTGANYKLWPSIKYVQFIINNGAASVFSAVGSHPRVMRMMNGWKFDEAAVCIVCTWMEIVCVRTAKCERIKIKYLNHNHTGIYWWRLKWWIFTRC